MSVKFIFILIILIAIIFLVQQSFFINIWSINLLLLTVIWFSIWRLRGKWPVVLMAGWLTDWQSTIFGPAIISYCLVAVLINYLANHFSLEGFRHFFLISLTALLAFFISYVGLLYFFSEILLIKKFWLFWEQSWWSWLELLISCQLILTIGYLFKLRKTN